MAEIKDEYIHLPRMDEEINYVERLFRACGHPGAIGSIDCVHVGWHKCQYKLKVQYARILVLVITRASHHLYSKLLKLKKFWPIV
jgi:hypothetical protein